MTATAPRSPAAADTAACDRPTTHISARQARELLAAAAYATALGLQLNAHATIKWELTDAGDDPDGRLLARLREGLSKHFDRARIPFACAWVRERARDGDPEHAHVLFHVPVDQRRDAEASLRRLLLHHAGKSDATALKVTYHSNGDVRYLLKGASAKIRRELDIKREWWKPQGAIFGKRCGFTENLGPSARRAHAKEQPVRQTIQAVVRYYPGAKDAAMSAHGSNAAPTRISTHHTAPAKPQRSKSWVEST